MKLTKEDEQAIFVIKPALSVNIVVTLLRFGVLAVILIGLLYYLKYENIITNYDVFRFFVSSLVFVFFSLILFMIINEQNKKLEFYEEGVIYSDLFNPEEFPRTDVIKMYYKEGIPNLFVLNKKGSFNKIVISFVRVSNKLENVKRLYEKPVKMTKIKQKRSLLTPKQLKRKKEIEDVITGRKKVVINKGSHKKVNNYIPLSSSKSKEFIGLDRLNTRYKGKGFIDINSLSKEEKDIFLKLEQMKSYKDLFTEIKHLKKNKKKIQKRKQKDKDLFKKVKDLKK